MNKPTTFDGYTEQYTVDCERVLVNLLRRIGLGRSWYFWWVA